MEEAEFVRTAVIAGSALFVLVALVVIGFVFSNNKKYFIQQSKLQRAEYEKEQAVLIENIRVQEQERSRIAADLHDEVGVRLSMMQLNLSKVAFDLKSAGAGSAVVSGEVKNLDEVIQHIRNICHDLYPVKLDKFGFVQTVSDLCKQLKVSGQLNVELDIKVEEQHLFAEREKKLSLLRIFQEVLNNILKYAGCTQLKIEVLPQDGDIIIIFDHNGRLFDNTEAAVKIADGSGLGLSSISNRLNLLGGKINYGNNNNQASVSIFVPINV
jgi:signal transduction histidine kinase